MARPANKPTTFRMQSESATTAPRPPATFNVILVTINDRFYCISQTKYSKTPMGGSNDVINDIGTQLQALSRNPCNVCCTA